MATLVLTTVGTIVGGPIGGAIGAMLGQRVDQALFAPKPREGPRLGDLAIQTSSYGSAIPKIFGTMRAAGTVIWSTDIREERSTSGGGKGQPKAVNYSYSASFAVAISGRPIRAIHRIWADGKLLRGAAGDFKARTGFRFHPGSEDQPVDPLIASAEGVGQAPAFRGIAYALFEDLALEDFGNRIPSLTFEVEAEQGCVHIGAVASELSGGALGAGETPSLAGYAAGGDSVRGAIEALTDAVPLSVVETDGGLVVRSRRSAAVALPEADRVGPLRVTRSGAGKLPRDVTISYYDAARDYQIGLQRAFRPGSGARSHRRELPAVLDAGAAKRFAEDRLAHLWAGAMRARIEFPWRSAVVRAGAHVELPSRPGLWRVERWTLGAGKATLELVGVADASFPPGEEASPGRPVVQPDRIHGPTFLRLHDLPLGDEPGIRPLVVAVAAGAMDGWRRAHLMSSVDGGSSWQGAGATAAAAVVGSALSSLAPGEAAMFDDRSSVDVELLSEGMWLESRNDDALVGEANLAVIGRELIQFGRAEPLGQRRFRLSRLLRGRRGTEWAATGHEAGEPFTLIERAALVPIDIPATAVGAELQLMASGIGDDEPAAASVQIIGSALEPPSPVHLRAQADGAGGVRIGWVRRSRSGWAWPSGSDTPLGEEAEAYRVTISGTGFERVIAAQAPHYSYTAEQRSTDGSGPVDISVVQIGTFATSRPACLRLD